MGTLTTSNEALDANSSILLTMTRPPNHDVTVTITCSDETEAIVDPAMVIFTPDASRHDNLLYFSNFSLVNVIGQDDDDVDGDQEYTIRMNFESDDPRFVYDNEYQFKNLDDDIYGLELAFDEASLNYTTELGGEVTGTLKLASRPTGSVLATFAVTESSEATVTPTLGVLGPDTWNTGVGFVIQGKSDGLADGDTTYKLEASVAITADAGFEGLGISSLTVGSQDEPLNLFKISLRNETCITNEGMTAPLVLDLDINNWPLADKDYLFVRVQVIPGRKHKEGSAGLLSGAIEQTVDVYNFNDTCHS